MTGEQFRNENLRLIEKFRSGDKEALDKIVDLNLKLVHKIANDLSVYCFYHHSISEEDLFQVGCIGLLKAIETFDAAKGTAFSSYATVCIKHDILMYTDHLTRTDRELPTLNNPIKEGKSENLEAIDTLPSNFLVEDEVFGNDPQLFKSILSTLHPCEQEYLTMVFFHQSPPEQIAKKFNFLPQDVPNVTKNMISTLKKRAKGNNSYSIVCEKYFYDHNVANFRKEMYGKLSPICKSYFDSTVLGKPILSLQQFCASAALPSAKAAALHRNLDLKMDTFYCKNILEINNCSAHLVRSALSDQISGDSEQERELFSIMSATERKATEMLLSEENTEKISSKTRRGILKKMIYYEKLTKNNEKIAKNHII